MNDPLTRALRKLRPLQPSPEFGTHLAQSLEKVDRAKDHRVITRSSGALHRGLGLALPALGSAVVVTHLLISSPNFGVSRVAEHTVDMPDVGPAALDLGFWLERHEADFASVRVHVPHGMKLTPSAHAEQAATDCHDTGCVHEFLHPTKDDAPHARVEVSQPGRYRVKVEHASEGRRVREILVVHALR